MSIVWDKGYIAPFSDHVNLRQNYLVMKFLDSKGPLILLACLTLGLAPFVPEPHIWSKIRWIAGGAVGMGAMDWFDVLLHGTPWILLVIFGVRKLIALKKG